MAANKKKVVPPALSVAEYRAKLGTYGKKIEVEVAAGLINGPLAAFATEIKRLAAASEIQGDWKLLYRPAKSGYYRSQSTPAKIAIIGKRPFTDAEIEAQGPSILRAKEAEEKAAEKKRAADVAKFNAIAGRLGVQPLAE